jgi:hypothetical protein
VSAFHPLRTFSRLSLLPAFSNVRLMAVIRPSCSSRRLVGTRKQTLVETDANRSIASRQPDCPYAGECLLLAVLDKD